ncbi:MAG: hypothetical protein JSR19_01705 [Proteobacteria bacterium]|nr:hypothetical protein [Pseudomonadota bacterium]HQR03512.1 hypothetical protein [Rhodocyclaceae bacterium]
MTPADFDFALPPCDNLHAPCCIHVRAARAWIETLPIDSPAQSQAALCNELEALLYHRLPAAERIDILDLLGQRVIALQQETLARYGGKPLPLASSEQAAFDAANAVWMILLQGYLRAVADTSGKSAPALQRALSVLVEWQSSQLLARRQPAPAHWRRLHQLLSLAEHNGQLHVPVADAGGHKTTVLATYGSALLMQAAGPYELLPPQLGWMLRWARRWGGRLTWLTAPPTKSPALPLSVNPASDHLLHHASTAADRLYFFGTAELRRHLKSCIEQLEAGAKPILLRLGDDCTQPACGQLLRRLYPRWCKGGVERKTERHRGVGHADLVIGLESSFLLFSRTHGKYQSTSSPPVSDPPYPVPYESEIAIIDQSAQGLHLLRQPATNANRAGPGHLLAVRPGDTDRFFLAVARWTAADPEGCIHLGLQLLPGTAQAAAIRYTGTHARSESPQPGFLLPAVPALNSPASIILSVGAFRPGRIVETGQGGLGQTLILETLLERGEDFDRATYRQEPG